MSAAYKKRVTQVKTVNQGALVFDDFTSPAAAGNYNGLFFFSSVTATGVAQKETITSNFSYPGAVRLTGDVSGAAARMQNNWSLSGTSFVDIQTRNYIAALSTGSEAFFTTFGYSTNLSSLSATDQAIIYYDQTVSNNYICKVTVAGVSTQTITTIPVAALTDTYFRVTIVPNFVYFSINGVTVATIAASPTPSSTGFIGVGITKTNGVSTPGVIWVDAISIVESFITPRTFLATNP